MPELNDAPREAATAVAKGTTETSRRTHLLLIVAAGAVTLFCLAGIGMMTGLIPGAQSLETKTGSSTMVPGLGWGTAMAPLGSVSDVTMPETTKNPAAATTLPPIRNSTLGQPNARLDAKSAATRVQPTVPGVAASVPAGSRPSAAASQLYAPGGAAAINPAGSPVNAPDSTTDTQFAANYPEGIPAPVCRKCGVVDAITAIEKPGEGSGAGAVLGGLIGGVIGHQAGQGRGRDIATAAGAVGGALIGNQIEKSNKGTNFYEVRVRMDDNSLRTARFDGRPAMRIGDRVRFEHGGLFRR